MKERIVETDELREGCQLQGPSHLPHHVVDLFPQIGVASCIRFFGERMENLGGLDNLTGLEECLRLIEPLLRSHAGPFWGSRQRPMRASAPPLTPR
jgi:hypothetical protein